MTKCVATPQKTSSTDKLGQREDVQKNCRLREEEDTMISMKEMGPGRGINLFTLVIFFFGAVGGFLFGLDTGATGIVTGMDGFRNQVGWPVTDPPGMPTCGDGMYQDNAEIANKASLILFVFHGAAMVGAPFAGEVNDRFGRRLTIFIACVVFAVGAIFQAAAGALEPGCGDCLFRDMIIGRLLGGVGLGFLLSGLPMYLSELMPAKYRGAGVNIFQLCVNFAILVCNILGGWWVQYEENRWRILIALQAIPAIILALGVVFVLPASPRYLLHHNKEEQALTVLRQLSQGSQTSLSPSTTSETPEKRENSSVRPSSSSSAREVTTESMARAELAGIKQELAELREAGSFSWIECFSGPALTALLTAVMVAAGQNLTGVNYFMNFGPQITKMLCMDAWVGAVILQVVNVISTLCAVFLSDRVGRKVLMTGGALTITLAFLIASAIFTAIPDLESSPAAGMVILVLVYIFMFAFGISWGPVGWLIPSEVLPIQARGKGMALAVVGNMLASILMGDYGPQFLSSPDVLGVTGAWWFMTALNCVWVLPTTLFLLPETKGLSMEEIHYAFAYTFNGSKGKSTSHHGSEIDVGTMGEFYVRNGRQSGRILRCRPVGEREGLRRQSGEIVHAPDRV